MNKLHVIRADLSPPMKNTFRHTESRRFMRSLQGWVRTNLIRFVCLGVSGLASVAISADTHWPIEAPELIRDELIAVALPPPLFANGQANATTLRVRDDQGAEIPARYELQQTVTHAHRRIPTAPFTMLAAEMPDGVLRLTLQRPESKPATEESGYAPIEGLMIQTPLRNFEQQVTVEGSDDGVNWTPLVEQAALFDFSRHADVRRTEIVFTNGITLRHLRLTFEQAVDVQEQLTALITATQSEEGSATESRAVYVDTRPFHVASVNGWTSSWIETSRETVLTDYPIAWRPLTNGVPRNKIRYAIDAQGQPLTHLNVAIPDDYASWPYVLTTDPPTAGPPLARGVLKQFRFRGITDADTGIVFPETRAQRYLLTFDLSKTDVADITARGPRYRIVFPARTQNQYTLIQLVEPEKRLPDTAQIVALLKRDVRPIDATLEAPPQLAVGRHRGYSWLRDHFFYIGIGVALLALTFSLARALRRL